MSFCPFWPLFIYDIISQSRRKLISSNARGKTKVNTLHQKLYELQRLQQRQKKQ